MANTDQELVDFTNKLGLATAETLQAVANHLAQRYGAEIAVTITVDAGLSAAVAMLQSAVLAGSVSPCDTDETLRKRLDYILSLPARFHERRPDGSFDPVGLSRN